MTLPDDTTAQPPAPDERWPGWAVDLLIAELGAAALSGALLAAIPAGVLAAAFATWAKALAPAPGWEPGVEVPDMGGGVSQPRGPSPKLGGVKPTSSDPKPDVRAWLTEQVPTDYLTAELEPALRDIADEGTLAGRRSAQAVIDAKLDGLDLDNPAVVVSVNWDGWKPGHPEAARKILSADGVEVHWRDLLARDGITIESIAEGRLDEIAIVLADGLERGASPDEIATALRGVLDDSVWARKVAVTETNRALSAATLDEYAESGVDGKSWMTAFDQRVCKICKRNEDEGAIPLDAEFPSGQLHPPGHPWCRCGLLPEFDLADIVKAVRGDSNGLKQFWTRGEGLPKWIGSPHPWTSLYHHLRKHIKSDALAKRTAARWFHDTTGMWPGERKGNNPVGPG